MMTRDMLDENVLNNVFDDDMIQDDDDLEMLDDVEPLDDIDPDEMPDEAFEEEEPRQVPKKRAKSRSKTKSAKKPKPVLQWASVIKKATSDNTSPYKITCAYKPGEYIQHTKFGVGYVADICSKTKVEVLFEEGSKRLVCNIQR